MRPDPLILPMHDYILLICPRQDVIRATNILTFAAAQELADCLSACLGTKVTCTVKFGDADISIDIPPGLDPADFLEEVIEDIHTVVTTLDKFSEGATLPKW